MRGWGEGLSRYLVSHTKTQRRMRDSGGLNFVDLQGVAVHDGWAGNKIEVRE